MATIDEGSARKIANLPNSTAGAVDLVWVLGRIARPDSVGPAGAREMEARVYVPRVTTQRTHGLVGKGAAMATEAPYVTVERTVPPDATASAGATVTKSYDGEPYDFDASNQGWGRGGGHGDGDSKSVYRLTNFTHHCTGLMESDGYLTTATQRLRVDIILHPMCYLGILGYLKQSRMRSACQHMHSLEFEAAKAALLLMN